jgi:hypothetical protein
MLLMACASTGEASSEHPSGAARLLVGRQSDSATLEANTMRWKTAAGVAAVVLCVVVYVGRDTYRQMRYAEAFPSVRVGKTVDDVQSLMGEPDATRRRPSPLRCEVAECEFEFLYGTSSPSTWRAIGFNSDAEVVWTGYLQTP